LLFPPVVFLGRRIGQGILELGQQRQQFVDTVEPLGDSESRLWRESSVPGRRLT
jgi:hypothetical protein